jgi:hypothetical protein
MQNSIYTLNLKLDKENLRSQNSKFRFLVKFVNKKHENNNKNAKKNAKFMKSSIKIDRAATQPDFKIQTDRFERETGKTELGFICQAHR